MTRPKLSFKKVTSDFMKNSLKAKISVAATVRMVVTCAVKKEKNQVRFWICSDRGTKRENQAGISSPPEQPGEHWAPGNEIKIMRGNERESKGPFWKCYV